MADDNLNTPVIIQASRIDSTLLPVAFSMPYRLYVIQQGADLGAVAGKANEAGQGAYDAQVKNEEQDLALANHEGRISAAEVTLVNHEGRISANEAQLANHEIRITQNTNDISALTVRVVTAESAIVTLQANVATLTTRVTTAEGNITTLQTSVSSIQTDYVSKSSTSDQVIQASGGALIIGSVTTPTTDKLQVAGSGNFSVSYKVAGVQVIGARQTGWTAATGTALLGAFNANQAYTVSAAYTQAEIQALAAGLVQARQRIKALEDMARTHGLMN